MKSKQYVPMTLKEVQDRHDQSPDMLRGNFANKEDSQLMMSVYEDVIEVLEENLDGEITDGYIVVGIAVGCVEPGYYDDETVMVFGDWNNKRYRREGELPLTEEERFPSILAEKLEEAGAEIEWYDEWAICDDCRRAMRIRPDSYSWTMYGALIGSKYVCAECMVNNFEDFVEEYINDERKAITWCESPTLIENGWVQWEPENPQQYENGFHPGQTDDPKMILEAIQDEDKDLQVIFLIDDVGQFDIRFSAWVKPEPEDG